MKRTVSQPVTVAFSTVFSAAVFAFLTLILVVSASAQKEESGQNADLASLVGLISEKVKELPTNDLGVRRPTPEERSAAEQIWEASNKILAAQLSDKDRIETTKYQAFALIVLAYDEPFKYFTVLSEQVEKYDEQKGCEKVARFAELHTLRIASMLVTNPNNNKKINPKAVPVGIKSLVERMLYFIETYPGKDADELVRDLIGRIDRIQSPVMRDRLMLAAAKPFAAFYITSKIPEHQTYGKSLHLKARFLDLAGKPMRILGYTPEGEEFDPASLKGKVVLVQFWASWCIPCQEEFPLLIDLYAKYRKKGLEILGVNEDEKPIVGARFVKERKFGGKEITWPILLEGLTTHNEKVTMKDYYGIEKIPVLVLIGRDGNVVRVNPMPSTLEMEIQKALYPQLSEEELLKEQAALQESTEAAPVKKLESTVLEELQKEMDEEK